MAFVYELLLENHHFKQYIFSVCKAVATDVHVSGIELFT